MTQRMLDLGFEASASGMGMLGAVPSSLATQMTMATGCLYGMGGKERGRGGEDTDGMIGRLMLARMKSHEEGMRTAENSNEYVDAKKKGKEKGMKKRPSAIVRSSNEQKSFINCCRTILK